MPVESTNPPVSNNIDHSLINKLVDTTAQDKAVIAKLQAELETIKAQATNANTQAATLKDDLKFFVNYDTSSFKPEHETRLRRALAAAETPQEEIDATISELKASITASANDGNTTAGGRVETPSETNPLEESLKSVRGDVDRTKAILTQLVNLTREKTKNELLAPGTPLSELVAATEKYLGKEAANARSKYISGLLDQNLHALIQAEIQKTGDFNVQYFEAVKGRALEQTLAIAKTLFKDTDTLSSLRAPNPASRMNLPEKPAEFPKVTHATGASGDIEKQIKNAVGDRLKRIVLKGAAPQEV